jgi:hypothetical protein
MRKQGGTMTVYDHDDYAAMYADVCDVIERTYHRWPLDDGDEIHLNHTSNEARAAAERIFKILDIRLTTAGQAILAQHVAEVREYLAGRDGHDHH